MRKCRSNTCRSPLPPQKKCETAHEKAGFCNHQCSLDYMRANQDKIRQKALRASEKAHKRRKREVVGKDLSHQKRLTQQTVNRLARLLDQGKPCISCGRPDDGSVQFCGGHYLSRGAHPEMRFDLRNVNKQCNQHCNLRLSGNIHGNKHTHGYRQGLIDRYGLEYVLWLEGPHKPANYTCDDLIALRKELNAEIRRIEKGEKPSKDWRSLPQP